MAIGWPVIGYDFLNYDDPTFVSANPHVLTGLTWDNFKWAFSFGYGDYWHPVTWLSLMLDVSLFGPKPAGLHFTNLLLHAANAALVFWLLRRWTGSLWRSAIAAAFFAWHPLRVESFAWITERKDVLSTFFFLLTLWAYGSAQRGDGRSEFADRRSELGDRKLEAGGRTPEGGSQKSDDRLPISNLPSPICHLLLPLTFFALGLMSKAMIVTTPFLLLLLDYWPLGRISNFKFQISNSAARATAWPRLLIEKIPFLVLSAIFCVLTYIGQSRILGKSQDVYLAVPTRIENAFVAYGKYLEKTIWPVNLAPHYPYPGHWSAWAVGVGVLLVVGLSIAAGRAVRRYPFFFVGWFWFVGALGPVIGLTKGWRQYMADRFTYLPSIGLSIFVVWMIAAIVSNRRRARLVSGAAAMIALGLCVARTRDQMSYWRNSETLFRHTIAVTTNDYLAYYNLGCYLENHGDINSAVQYFRKAVEINPGYAEAHNNLGIELVHAETHHNLDPSLAGSPGEGIEHLRTALRINPDYSEAHNNLGLALAGEGRTDEAIEEYNAALRTERNAEAYYNLGVALSNKGFHPEAIASFENALKVNPSLGKAQYNLGLELTATGRIDQAISHYLEAARLSPGFPQIYNNLAYALMAKGRVTEAIDYYREALKADPNYLPARRNLGPALLAAKRVDEAIPELAEALRREPGSAYLHNALAGAYESRGDTAQALAEARETLRLESTYAPAHVTLGRIFVSQGKTNEAKAEFSEALRLKPDYEAARKELHALPP
jgi:tetratricopeptide (TPR) repeat protein